MSDTTLQATIRINDAATPALQRMIAATNSLNRNFARMNQNLRNLGTGAGGTRQIQNDFSRIVQRTQHTVINVQRLNSRLQQSNLRVQRLDTRVRELQTAFQQATARIQVMESRLKASERDVLMLSVRVSELERELRRVAENIGGSNRQQQQFNGSLRQGGNEMGRIMGLARNLLTTYLGFRGTKALVGASDSYVSMNARLSLINDNLRTQSELQNAIYGAALRSRGAYKDMATVTSRLGLLAGNAFKNNDELIYFTETMQKAFKVSGASQMEASSAMYQLTQGMASGRLQGDEFRSILENAPMLAKSIEKYMKDAGVEGTLKDWSSAGLLTADVIKGALFSAADDINAMFSAMPMTFADVWNQITSTATKVFGSVLENINSLFNGFDEEFFKKVAGVFNTIAIYANTAILSIKGLIQDIAPSMQPIISGFSQVLEYVFSVNGLMGKLINTTRKLAQNKGVQQFFTVISKGAMLITQGIGWAIDAIGNLAQHFSGFLPLIGGAIVAFTTFHIVSSGLSLVISGVNSGLLLVNKALQITSTLANVAAAAQRGLNAAFAAAPLGAVASALLTVASALAAVFAGIKAVNAAAGVMSENPAIGGYDDEVWNLSEKMGISRSAAKNIIDNETVARDLENEKKDIAYESQTLIKDAMDKINENNEKMLPDLKTQDDAGKYAYEVVKSGNGSATQAVLVGTRSMIDPTYIQKHNEELLKDNEKQYAIIREQTEIANEASNEIYKTNSRKDILINETLRQDYGFQEMLNEIDLDFSGVGDSGIGDTLGDIKDDTGKISDSIDLSQEYLELMKEAAEREAVNKFTTVPLYLDARSTNNVSTEMDLDAMVTYINNELWNGLSTAAEGAHF